jgi:hypothetical protein
MAYFRTFAAYGMICSFRLAIKYVCLLPTTDTNNTMGSTKHIDQVTKLLLIQLKLDTESFSWPQFKMSALPGVVDHSCNASYWKGRNLGELQFKASSDKKLTRLSHLSQYTRHGGMYLSSQLQGKHR